MKTMTRFFLLALVLVAVAAGVIIYQLGKPAETSQNEVVVTADAIIINEVMAANKSAFPDENGDYEDWIEIYNPNATPVNLSQYTLSNKKNKLEKWVFPDADIAAHSYLVIFASGTSNSNLDAEFWHANFKLSKDGDTIYLSRSGQTVDSVDYAAMPGNTSYGRSAAKSSEWLQFSKPTPGFENSEKGASGFSASMTIGNSPIIITEAMPANNSTLTDKSGQYADWVEIFNRGDKALNLEGYGLSDDPGTPLLWRFPAVTIEPGEYLLVFASGDTNLPAAGDPATELHANFRLSAYQENIVLSDERGRKLDSLFMQEVAADQSFARKLDEADAYISQFDLTSQPTPGFPNTQDGYDSFTKDSQLSSGPVIISEVLSSNAKYAVETDGKFYDWIELYNQSDKAVDLSGYGLTDNTKNPVKWRFSQTSIDPGEYLVVLAAGSDRPAETEQDSYIHTNFNLSKNGEVLALFDNTGKMVDKLLLGVLPQNVSYGRENGREGFFYFTDPTPGLPNADGSMGYAHVPQFVLSPGLYSGKQTVEIKTASGEQVYYTLDANPPTEKSQLYSGPITIDRTAVLRVRAFKPGLMPSAVVSGTYIIDEPHSLPVMALVTTPDNLWNETTGIYMEGPNASQVPGQYKAGANYYQDTEVPASFEVYDQSGKRVFSQDLALCMSGGLSLRRPQKTFAIHARAEYGSSTMQYSFFDNRPFTEYKSLLFRQGGRDLTKIKEPVALRLVDGKMNVMTQAIKPYVLYLNGEYWGVYYMMEKRNKYMIAAQEGIQDPDSMNILKGNSLLRQGTKAEYVKILEYIKTHDLSKQENFDYVAARIDTASFMDYMVNEIYIANNDPGNMQFYQILPEGKWKQIYFDFCITFYSFDTLTMRMKESTTGSSVFNGLLSYKPWRDQFIERFAWALKEIYNPQRVIGLIDQAANDISSEIAAEHVKFSDTLTVEEWNQSVQSMRNFANNRGKAVVSELKRVFDLTDAQIKLLDDAIS